MRSQGSSNKARGHQKQARRFIYLCLTFVESEACSNLSASFTGSIRAPCSSCSLRADICHFYFSRFLSPGPPLSDFGLHDGTASVENNGTFRKSNSAHVPPLYSNVSSTSGMGGRAVVVWRRSSRGLRRQGLAHDLHEGPSPVRSVATAIQLCTGAGPWRLRAYRVVDMFNLRLDLETRFLRPRADLVPPWWNEGR